jgi:hypothetical protein
MAIIARMTAVTEMAQCCFRVLIRAPEIARLCGGVPGTRIHHIGGDWEHGDSGAFQREFDETVACGRRARAERVQDEGRINAMALGLVDNPFVGPWRVVQLLIEADGTAGKGFQWVVEAIADVTVGSEGQIHGPDKDCAVFGFEGGVEIHIVPESGAYPHEAEAFFGTCRNSLFDAGFHFVTESAGVGDGPFGAAQPLGRHDVADLFLHADRSFWSAADEIANLFEVFFLAVYAFHERAEAVEIEGLRGDVFKPRDQTIELGDHEIEAMGFGKFEPAMAA